MFDPTCCFVSGKPLRPSATGDHLYEVRNYYRVTGRYGVDAQWNRIPVHHSVNTKYKVFEIAMPSGTTVKRNVGHETLTEEEYDACTPKQRFVYDLLQQWKAYVGYRGARLSYALPRETSERMNEVVRRALAMIDEEAAVVADEYRAMMERRTAEESESQEVTEVDTTSMPLQTTVGSSSPQPSPRPSSSSSPQYKCLSRASHNSPAPPFTPPTETLPPHDQTQWRIEKRVRQTGKSAGKFDTYYYHIVTGKVCRSKPETRRYQQSRATATFLQTQLPPSRPTLVALTRLVIPPSPVKVVRPMVLRQAVSIWVAAIVTWTIAWVASSPWTTARTVFASTCSRRIAKVT